jgi:hypothetical protein
VHSLQFVGSKKKSFAIDNLVVDLPSDFDDGSSFEVSGSIDSVPGDANGITINQVADVPEPASLLLFVLGSLGLILFSKSARFSLNQSPRRRIKPCQSIDA